MSAETKPRTATPLVSQLLLEDAGLRDIVEEFVAGLTSRLQELREAYAKLDFGTLALLAHRLKGAAGSYGYPDISRVCADMEAKFQAHEAGDFSTLVSQLAELCAAARAGLRQVS